MQNGKMMVAPGREGRKSVGLECSSCPRYSECLYLYGCLHAHIEESDGFIAIAKHY